MLPNSRLSLKCLLGSFCTFSKAPHAILLSGPLLVHYCLAQFPRHEAGQTGCFQLLLRKHIPVCQERSISQNTVILSVSYQVEGRYGGWSTVHRVGVTNSLQRRGVMKAMFLLPGLYVF